MLTFQIFQLALTQHWAAHRMRLHGKSQKVIELLMSGSLLGRSNPQKTGGTWRNIIWRAIGSLQCRFLLDSLLRFVLAAQDCRNCKATTPKHVTKTQVRFNFNVHMLHYFCAASLRNFMMVATDKNGQHSELSQTSVSMAWENVL